MNNKIDLEQKLEETEYKYQVLKDLYKEWKEIADRFIGKSYWFQIEFKFLRLQKNQAYTEAWKNQNYKYIASWTPYYRTKKDDMSSKQMTTLLYKRFLKTIFEYAKKNHMIEVAQSVKKSNLRPVYATYLKSLQKILSKEFKTANHSLSWEYTNENYNQRVKLRRLLTNVGKKFKDYLKREKDRAKREKDQIKDRIKQQKNRGY